MNRDPKQALDAAANDSHRLLAEAESALKSASQWSLVGFVTGIFYRMPSRYERVETAHKKLRRSRRALRRFNDACQGLDLARVDLDPLRRAAAPMPPVIEVWHGDLVGKGLFFLRLRSMRRAISRTRSQLDLAVAEHRAG